MSFFISVAFIAAAIAITDGMWQCDDSNDDGGHLVKAGQAPFVEKPNIGKCLGRKAKSTKSDDPKTSGIACDIRNTNAAKATY